MGKFLFTLAVVLGFMWAGGGLLFWLALPQPAGTALRTDVAIVLTGDAGRVARGLEVVRAGLAPQLLISGVHESVTAASISAQNPGYEDLFDCCVTLDSMALDTVGNAQESIAWMRASDVRSARLITSDYHIPRAAQEFRALAPDVSLVLDAVPSRKSWGALLLEYNKYAWRLLSLNFLPQTVAPSDAGS